MTLRPSGVGLARRGDRTPAMRRRAHPCAGRRARARGARCRIPDYARARARRRSPRGRGGRSPARRRRTSNRNRRRPRSAARGVPAGDKPRAPPCARCVRAASRACAHPGLLPVTAERGRAPRRGSPASTASEKPLLLGISRVRFPAMLIRLVVACIALAAAAHSQAAQTFGGFPSSPPTTTGTRASIRSPCIRAPLRG